MTLDEWLDAYYETFGENYPLMITGEISDAEIISDITKCLESNTPATPMELDSEFIY